MNNLNLENIKGKRVLVVGLGKSGIAAVQAMLKLGADVSVQDSKEAEAVDGQLLTFLEGKGVSCYFHEIPEHVENFDMLILSPGVNPELPFIREAEMRNLIRWQKMQPCLIIEEQPDLRR